MLAAERVALRPLRAGDEEALLRIHTQPEVRRWWGDPEDGFPWGDDPLQTRLAIELGGRLIGMVQFYEETTPRYRHASVDLFIDASHHGAGLGAETLGLVVAELAGRGHHRITIDPALANAAAIRCYEKVGFERVGVMRCYERDVDGQDWHDALLMELLLPAAG
ncbi:MAG TPA: GNAT family protein [Solirubrobacteraceae bacterium]|jgi:aminoglycoside 6'-N-acetyltransferase|nr:GNAT family protein [Solirubrobacteraceae bacterium]